MYVFINDRKQENYLDRSFGSFTLTDFFLFNLSSICSLAIGIKSQYKRVCVVYLRIKHGQNNDMQKKQNLFYIYKEQ